MLSRFFSNLIAILLIAAGLTGVPFAFTSGPEVETPVGASGAPPDAFGLDRPPRKEPGVKRKTRGDKAANVGLRGTNEPHMAVDPNNPLHVAVASAYQINVSIDGGLTFGPPVYAPHAPGWSTCGDSALAYDSQGRLFWTFLGCRTGLLVMIVQCDPVTGAVLPGYPVNVGAAVGYPDNAANDKEWLAIDIDPDSPFHDRIYMVWTDVQLTSRVAFAYSSDQGHTWTGLKTLSTSAEGFSWPPHVATAPNGDVYVSYHAPRPSGTAGRVFLCRSSNGGVSFPQKTLPFPAGRADVTFNVQSAAGTAIPRTDFWLQGNGQANVMADPHVAGRIYVVAADDPDDNLSAGDASNVYLATSNDHGVTFGAPVRIDDGPGTTFAVMPTPAIDSHTGAMLVHWYDNRRGALNNRGNYLLDVFARWSTDGGVTWSASRQINDSPFDPDLNAPCRFDCIGGRPTLRIGEYNGAGIVGEAGFAAWCGNDPYGYQETVFARFTLDLYAPTITQCPVDTTVECADACGTPAGQLSAWLAGFKAIDSVDTGLTLSHDAPSCFPLGETTVTFTAMDDEGHSATCTAVVRVEDTTAPAIVVTLERDVLWPPNHQLVEICDTVHVHDACDETPAISLVSIDSSEPDNDRGDGNSTGDIQDVEPGTDDRCFALRSERAASGGGRKYTIVYAAEDHEGNVGYDTVCVRVPHDRSADAIASDGFVANGTALQDAATQLTIVIPSAAGFDAAALDVTHVYLGNTHGVVRPGTSRLVDVTGDNVQDVALSFEAIGVARAFAGTMPSEGGAADRTHPTDGQVGLHFVSPDGVDYLVANIFALGPAVAMPSVWAHSDEPSGRAPAGTALTSISPNPFNPEVSISFHLETSEHVRIVIFDVRGAVVRRLRDGVLPAGDQMARWDGTDDAGRVASSGVYFVRLNAPSLSTTQKIVMLK